MNRRKEYKNTRKGRNDETTKKDTGRETQSSLEKYTETKSFIDTGKTTIQ